RLGDITLDPSRPDTVEWYTETRRSGSEKAYKRIMAEMYPALEPYASGLLEVGDVQRVYWESCGDPQGKPAGVLHGGAGSGCSPWFRRLFDPHAYRIILFDQRNCGRSAPHAGDPEIDLAQNTTDHLIADIERLRQVLQIDRWLVFGGS